MAALALHLKNLCCCRLTPQHIKGKENTITDIPSRSFGSVPQRHFKLNNDLQTFFNSHFPLPNQTSWNVFHLHSNVAMHVILILQTKQFLLDEWRGLPKIGSLTGTTGPNMSHLWDWTLIYRTHHLHGKSEHSQDLLYEHNNWAFGAGHKIQSRTVSGYITSIGQTIALAFRTNLVKMLGSNKFLMRLQQTLNGWHHKDPPTSKKLPVESDVPEFLVNKSGHHLATALNHAVADLTTIAFYYLLWIGEYTVKGTRKWNGLCNLKWRMSHSSKKTNADESCVYHATHPSPTYYQQMGQHSNWTTKRMDTREYVYTNKQPATPSTVQSARWDNNTNTSRKIRLWTKHLYVPTGWMDRRTMSQTIISARP